VGGILFLKIEAIMSIVSMWGDVFGIRGTGSRIKRVDLPVERSHYAIRHKLIRRGQWGSVWGREMACGRSKEARE
jgi:hypothetical protein